MAKMAALASPPALILPRKGGGKFFAITAASPSPLGKIPSPSMGEDRGGGDSTTGSYSEIP
jgi:hypothetical protein